VERIGLIAGKGKLPVIFAKEARKRGVKVIGFAVKEMALPEFDSSCDRAHRLSIKNVKKFLLLLVAERIKKIVMLGKFDKSIIYKDIKKSEEALRVLGESKDKNDYSILDRVTSELGKVGVKVISGLEYMGDFMPEAGVLTKSKPSQAEYEDIKFGFKIAKEIAGLDIGQTVIVKDKSIVSVEAMEGTNRAIKRAALLCGEGFTVVKASRPGQDMRWDVPVIGPETIKLIAENKGKALAIEEKKMFLVEKEASIKLADENNISIVVI
jgi:DUF1009 family protein